MGIFSTMAGRNRGPSTGDRWRTAMDEESRSGANVGESRNRYISALGSGEEELERLTRSTVNRAMPKFYDAIQGVRESAIQRGISTGDLGTSYEGDVATEFDQNIKDSVAGHAMNLYNTRVSGYGNVLESDQYGRNRYLDMLSGTLDREQAARNAKKGGLLRGLGKVAGFVGGTVLGPIGGAVGSKLGEKLAGKID